MPGRIRSGYHAGACRQCGQHDLGSAPPNCTRCAFEAAIEANRAPAVDREVLLGPRPYDACAQDLTMVVEHVRKGRIAEGRFQVFVDPGDNMIRPLHGADNVQGLFEHRSAASAEEVAKTAARQFDSAWVVTHDGLWRVKNH
jgi:hypothetical protein